METLTARAIRQAFAESGFRVLDQQDQVTAETYLVDADIDRFWSRTNPGFAAITLSTEISAQVSIRSPQGVEKQSVSIKAADNYQTGMEGNWIEVAGKALRAFIDNLRNRIK
ncbi:hypothetical protein [Propionivibrio soli]|uniref:hypothetical protein n=1 Tax=Propionivibrio soli TaxID=2976531 RepID=UPI0021E78FC7|nr:hypothetical protein [Propionivibrio soli]